MSQGYQRLYYLAHAGRISERDSKRRPEINSRRKERRDEVFREIVALKSNPCIDCENRFPTCCMDFDHRPGTEKRRCVSKMVGYNSLETILSEIGKCDLVCRNCHRLRTQSRVPLRAVRKDHVERNIAMVEGIKKNPCFDCGSSFPTVCMDLDHVRGVKVMPVSRLTLQSSLDRLIQELWKCDLVCANCHAVRTHVTRQGSFAPAEVAR